MFAAKEINKSDWSRVKLGDVVTKREENDKENAGNRFELFLKVEHLDAGSLHIKRWANQEMEELPPTFYKIFRKGQILFPTRNPHLRRTALASFDGICGEKTLTLEPNENLVFPGFIPFLFHSENFYAHTTTSIVGSTNPHVRWRDVANYEFLLPPKGQQNKLAELLWGMDEVVEKELDLLKKMKITREVHFEELVSQSEGQEIKLSDVLILKKSKSPVPHKREKYIGLEHVNPGTFFCDNYADSSTVLAQCNLVDEGDLCYSKLRPYLDKAFISKFDAVSTTELLIYDVEGVSKDYVLNLFHSKSFVDYVAGKGFGTKMPRVNHKIIGEYRIKKLADEKALLEKIKQYQLSEKEIEIKINSSQMLYKSLISQVF